MPCIGLAPEGSRWIDAIPNVKLSPEGIRQDRNSVSPLQAPEQSAKAQTSSAHYALRQAPNI